MTLWAWDFEHMVFAVIAAIVVVLAAVIFWLLTVHTKLNIVERNVGRADAKTSFVESTCETLAMADYDHTRKIKSLNNRFDDISTRVREIEKSLYEVFR